MSFVKQPSLVLRVWEGDCGAPSMHPLCIQAMTLMVAHNFPGKFVVANIPQWLAIPSLTLNRVTFIEPSEIITSLMQLFIECAHDTLDTFMDERMLGNAAAYSNYFNRAIPLNLYFECWVNDTNYEAFIKPWFQKAIPFPFSHFHLKKERAKAKDVYEITIGSKNAEEFRLEQNEIISKCLMDFSKIMDDDRHFFFGDDPSTLDILIYSYLVLAVKIPLPDSFIQNEVKSHPKLMRFIENMHKKYFPSVPSTYKYIKPSTFMADNTSTSYVVMAGLTAATAMFLYAYVIGKLSLKLPRFS